MRRSMQHEALGVRRDDSINAAGADVDGVELDFGFGGGIEGADVVEYRHHEDAAVG